MTGRRRAEARLALLLMCMASCARTPGAKPPANSVRTAEAPAAASLHDQVQSALKRRPARNEELDALAKRIEAELRPSPRDFELVHGYVALQDRRGRADAAEAQVARWRDETEEAAVESVLSLWLAQRLARTGRLAKAAAEIRRHIRTGAAVDADSYVWAGSLALARTELEAAADFFRQALSLSDRRGPGTPRALAQAAYGLALVRDLQAEPLLVDEALAIGTLYDGGDLLVRAACEGRLDLPVWNGPEARYLCALVHARIGPVRGAEAPTFADLEVASLPPAWRARARRWKGERTTHEAATPPAGAPLRVLAVLTTRTDGPWPAPLFDVSWRRKDLLKPCLGPAPVAGVQRLTFRLRVSLEGRIEQAAAVDAPPSWTAVATCLTERLANALSLPPAPPVAEPGATLVTVEVLLTSP